LQRPAQGKRLIEAAALGLPSDQLSKLHKHTSLVIITNLDFVPSGQWCLPMPR
jgi:hypothetical protein